jgi:S1-C subfamily serine protease
MTPLLPIVLASLLATTDQTNHAAEFSLVQVIVTTQEPHPILPWQNRETSIRVGYGVAIDGGLILTTEHLVRHSRLVELRKPRVGEKKAASVLIADSQVNLALLRAPQDSDPPSPALAVDGTFTRHARLTILQFDETSEVQRGDAQTVQMMMAPLSGAPHVSLAASLLTDLNVNGEGAPVVVDGKLVGLMMSYSRGERVGHMVPGPVIARFMELVRSPRYPGFSSAGFTWALLIDPVKRRYLGVTDPGRGVLVLSCLPASGASEVLKPNDVIMAWDGKPVDNMGYYMDPDLGRMELSHLTKIRSRVGDAVPVSIIRDRKPMSVRLSVGYWNDSDNLIPEGLEGEPTEYLVHGGLLIRELTGRYLQAGGGDWRQNADPRLTNLYLTHRMNPEKPGDRVVILSIVLPDPVNVGYQEFMNSVVTHINRQPVRNMRDVFRVFDADGGISRVTLKNVGVDLVLAPAAAAEANDRISRNFGIPALQYRRAEGNGAPPRNRTESP